MEKIINELLQNKPYFDVSSLTGELAYNRVFKVNDRALTLIHLAAVRSPKVLRQILTFKPDLNQVLMDGAWVTTSYHCTSFTPLFMAILNAKKENAMALIEAGSDLTITCPISGHSALSLAIFSEQWDLALELFNRKATLPLQEKRQNISILEKLTQSKDARAQRLKNKVFETLKFPALNYRYTNKQLANMRWRVLPTQLLWDLELGSSLESILKVQSPKLKQLIYKKIFKEEEINFTFLSFFYIFAELDLEYNFLCKLFEQMNMDEVYSWTESDHKRIAATIFFLKRFYSNKMIENFLMRTYLNRQEDDLEKFDGLWHDVFAQAEMLENELKDHQIKKLLPKKLKNLLHFHDEISLMMNKRNQQNYELTQSDLTSLHKLKFKDYTIIVPSMNYELIHAGIALKICVGGGQYGKKIIAKESQIIFLNKNDEIIYCVEFDFERKEIIQAKSLYNANMPDSMEAELQGLLNRTLWWPGRSGA